MQKIITSGKGVAIDYDNVARDAQGNSKELYLWGQSEQDDLKDGASQPRHVPGSKLIPLRAQ